VGHARSAPEIAADPERNSLGFRDDEHPLTAAPGVFRILVLGDSLTKGLGVPQRERIVTSVMQRRLDDVGRRAEVINFGVEGYNTQQEVEMLRLKGLAFRPDLVVLAYCLNDRDWPAHHLYRELLEQESASGQVAGARLSPWLRASALYRFLRFRVLPDPEAPAAGDGEQARIQELIDRVQSDTVEEYFGVLRGLSEAHGFAVVVAVFPWLESLAQPRLDQHRWVQALSARHGFHHLDLLPAFLVCERHYGQSLAADEVHPNILGHNCAGLAIADYIAATFPPPAG
jgi:lysophospholipase L1-like esterase